MTKRFWLTGVMCACFVSLASVAHAGIIEWIDQLSGPGGFVGFSIEARLHCWGVDKVTKLQEPRKEEPEPDRQEDARAFGVVLACPNTLAPTQRTGFTLNVASGVSWALNNNLKYAPNTETGVKLVPLEGSVWWYPLPPVAVGASIGNYWFSGPAFSTFSRFYVRPIQVELKPLAFPRKRWYTTAEILTVRIGYVLIPEGFQASDFGAIGPYQTEHEALPSVALLLDLGTLKNPKWLRWWH